MKIIIWLLVIVSVIVWGVYGAHLLNLYQVPYLSDVITSSFLPKNTSELGDSFGVLSSLLSPIALILALAALITQSKQQAASNNIGALSVRQQFLLSECERLEKQIKELKRGGKYEPNLFKNMVEKQKRYRDEAQIIDDKIKSLLAQF